MPQKILALNISDSELKAAVVETTFRDYKVTGLYREPLGVPGGALEDRLKRLVEQHAPSVDTILTALPGDRVTWRTIFLPFRDRKRLTQTIPFELESSVPFALDEVIVDYHVLSRDRAGTTVLAAMVPKSVLENHLEVLQKVGLDPKVVDVGPLSALNALSLIPDLPKTFAFLDLGARSTTVALYRDGELAGLRTLTGSTPGPLSGSTNGSGNGAAADGHPPSSLATEIRWTLLALNGALLEEGLPCLIAGDRDSVAALQPEIESELPVKVRVLDKLKVTTADASAERMVPAFASTIGLALREVAPNNAMGVNFRRDEFTFHRAQQELRRALRGVVALLSVVIALTVVQLFLDYRQLAGRVAQTEAQIQAVVNDALGTKGTSKDPRGQLQSELENLRGRVTMMKDIVPVSTSTSIDVLRAISGAVPNKVRIDSEEYQMDPNEVRLRANTDTFESVDSLKQQFLDTGFFQDVQVKDAKAGKDGAGVDFRMILVLSKEFRAPAAKASRR